MVENVNARTDEERILTQVPREKELEVLGGVDRREWAERVVFSLAAKIGMDRIDHFKLEIERLDLTIAITSRLQRERQAVRGLLAASLVCCSPPSRQANLVLASLRLSCAAVAALHSGPIEC